MTVANQTLEMIKLIELGYTTITPEKADSVRKAFGDRFEDVCAGALNKEVECIEVLAAAVSCLSDFVTKKLQDNRTTIPYPYRLGAAIRNPAEFLRLVTLANRGDQDSSVELVNFLRPVPRSNPGSQQSTKSDSHASSSNTANHQSSANAEARSASGESATEHGRSVHFYGGKGAFCLTEDMVRGSGLKTLRMEAAPKAGANYDWQNKISMQFTLKELLPFLAVCSRQLISYDFKNHGANSDKSFRIEFQNGKSFFFSMSQANRASIAIPVPVHEIYLAVTLILKQMVCNDPHMSVDHFLKMSASLMPDTPSQQRAAA